MTRLLVVDDSPLMRRVLGDTFREAGGFEVEIAHDGIEAIDKLHAFAPDVITLDIHMPGMDGLACLDRIMLERPTPVVMVSSLTAQGANETLEAIALGAVDFITKPAGAVSLAIDTLAPPLIEKVRAAAGARIPRSRRLVERVRLRAVQQAALPQPKTATKGRVRHAPSVAGEGLVVVGCSTGGPPALEALLTPLAADFPWPIVVAQHMPASFTGPLARRLDKICAVAVSEISRLTPLEAGQVYIGRGDADLIVARRSSKLVGMSAPSHTDYHWHPSVDRLVASAMEILEPQQLVGVLMTGMGADGSTTMRELKVSGGRTIAESQESAVVWGMPGALVRAGGASIVAPLESIASDLVALMARG